MAKHNVIFSKDNEYYTPKEFVKQFGNFDYDPATTKEKATEFGIQNYDTIETDGLKNRLEFVSKNMDQPSFYYQTQIY